MTSTLINLNININEKYESSKLEYEETYSDLFSKLLLELEDSKFAETQKSDFETLSKGYQEITPIQHRLVM